MTSKASNGSKSAPPNRPIPSSPIPAGALVHCLALLPESERSLAEILKAFLINLEERVEGLEPVDPASFAVLDRPRVCTFARISAPPWAWQVLIDPEGMPAEVQEAVLAGRLSAELLEQVQEHKLSSMVFLLEAPPQATPLERFRSLCRVAWAWLDSGATVLAFPEGQVACPRRLLLGLEPHEIQPEQAFIFLSNGIAEERAGKYWLRTWGLGQFGLPDLAAGLDQGNLQQQDLESLKLLFETLPAAMIRDHGILPVGGTVQTGGRTWSAVGPPSAGELPFMASRHGFQLFV